jgi:hypothetical protein
VPNRETVRKILEALKTKADSMFFFENLKSAAWVQPLFDEGLFSDPPAGEETDQGGVRYPPWPASQFLARVVEQAPEIVIGVVSKIPHTDNPSVHRDIVSIALKVPANLAKQLVPHVISGIESKGWDQEHFGELVAHLARGGEIQSALKIARKLLEFLPDPDHDQKRATPEADDPLTWMRARLEPHPRSPIYVYQRILENYIPILAQVAPMDTIQLLASLLDEGISLGVRDIQKAEGQDWSIIWYPTLDSPSHRLDFDAKAALTASLVKFTENAVARDPGLYPAVDKILSSHNWRIFERTRMRIASQHPSVAHEQIRRFAFEVPNVEGTDLNEEYFHLLHNHFGLLSEGERHEIIREILRGPNLQAFIERSYSGRRPPDEEVDAYVRRWKLFRLFPIKEHLAAEAAEEYAGLVHGQAEPSYRNYIHFHPGVESSWGPHSPKTQQELSAAEPREVLDFLKTWESVKGFNAPSPEGLARAFQQAVADQSSKFSEKAEAFAGIEPAYIRGLISGLVEAVKNGKAIDWPATLKLSRWVVEQPVEIEGRSAEKWDWEAGDPNWRGARKSIGNLIQQGSYVGAGEIPVSLRADVLNLLIPLTDDSDPTFEYENGSSWTNQPATLAINTVRGEAMHALISHAMWVHRHLPANERIGFAVMPEIQHVLERKLGLENEKTFAIRSVFGQYFAHLCAIDPNWVKASLSLIFPTEAPQKQYRDVAWNTYVTFNRPNAKVFPILLSEYERAVENLNEPKGTEHDLGDPDESLAEHLVTLYSWGVLNFARPESLLNNFYSVASDDLRGHAIQFIGKILDQDGEPLPDELRQRLVHFWEKRVREAKAQDSKKEFQHELLSFAWWLHSKKFDPDWLLDQTLEVLTLCKAVEHEFLFTQPLADLSAKYPAKVVKCLSLLVEKLRPEQSFVLNRENVETILKTSFQTSDVTVRDIAVAVRDYLLARGHFEYKNIGTA